MCLLNNLYAGVRGSTIDKSQNVESTQMTISEYMDLKNVVCPQNGLRNSSVD